MASTIPPTSWYSSETSVDPSEADLPSSDAAGFDLSIPSTDVQRSSGLIWVGVLIWSILALSVGVFAVSQGAPGFFLLFAIGMVIFAVVSAAVSENQRERLAMEKANAEMDAQERLRNDIAQAVKDSVKSNIMVRCRYCGSLNEENATKCSSCGATL